MTHSYKNMRVALAFSAVALVVGIAAPNARADEWNKKTVLTVNDTIQVQDAVLQPGQYVMKLLNSQSDRHVVQIFNSRENHVIATILAIPKYRLEPTGETQFSFYETPAGTARAMRAWYYPGDLMGQEFEYPKHPYQLTAAVTPLPAPPAAAVETAPAEAAPSTVPESQPTTTDMDVATPPETAPTPVETPAPVDQTPAPVATPDQAPAPEPAAPAELPKTASSYPLFGLLGLTLLGFGGLLRLRRQSVR